MFKYAIMISIALGFSVAQANENTQDADIINVVRESRSYLDEWCDDVNTITVKKVSHKYRRGFGNKTDPEQEATFYIASCPLGFNEKSVIFFKKGPNKFVVVPLSSPLFSVKNKTKDINIMGYISEMVGDAISYDSETGLLKSVSKQRASGDANTTASYAIFQDTLILRKYEHDGTLNGKIDPKVVFESKEPLK